MSLHILDALDPASADRISAAAVADWRTDPVVRTGGPLGRLHRVLKVGADAGGHRWALVVDADADPADVIDVGGATVPRTLTHLLIEGVTAA